MTRKLILCLFSLALAGCGAVATGPTATPLPTATPDPIFSFVPTPVSPGQGDNPLQMVLVPLDVDGAEDAALVFQSYLTTQADIRVDVVLAENTADALAQMCDFADDRAVAAWLSGPAPVIAEAIGCGEMVLQVLRDGEAGLAAEILGAPGVSSIQQMLANPFCRIGPGDFYSWLAPRLYFQANNADPERLGELRDFDEQDDMLLALAGSDCNGASVPAGTLDNEDLPNAVANLRVVADTPPFPYGVLFLPDDMLLEDRRALLNALVRLSPPVEENDDAAAAEDEEEDDPEPTATPAEDEDGEDGEEGEDSEDGDEASEESVDEDEPEPTATPDNDALGNAEQRAALSTLLGDTIVPIDPTELDDLRAMLNETGLNFAQLGDR